MVGKTLMLCVVLVALVELTRSYPQPRITKRYLFSSFFKRNPYMLRASQIENPKENQCVCMNGRYCEGTINSDVQCPSSYTQVCCIKPEPDNKNVPHYSDVDDHFDSFEYDNPALDIPGMEEIITH
ncbi:unnamed protein product [Psylliodes chrysocephalus]|uniref:Uncharacterized protein n=1 Tax=Psylliodes chrysocephalus TaxID=3402493 RepID=A0A9P0D1X5_9CUCU|nr:unnamed protein product [Psylliodes chrysocephala]